MYISRRTGGGRGVYEIAGRTHDNLSAVDIQRRKLIIRLDPYVRLQTNLQLRIQGGKPRLVIKKASSPQRIVQIQRQIAVILLLPKPIRADSGMGHHPHVIQHNEYVIERLGIQDSFLSEQYFDFIPNSVVLRNADYSLTLGFLARFAKVVTLWESEGIFPDRIAGLLTEHRDNILTGSPVTADTEKIVEKLYQSCKIHSESTHDTNYTEGADLFQLLDTISPTYITPIANEEPLAEEVDLSTIHYEGAKRQLTVNAYERNSAARKQCIAYYGYDCSVCGINFELQYGEIGREFIHVHHLKPLSELQETYQVDPIEDLRPVCPNCHAMLHKRKPPFTIEELRHVMVENA